VSRRLLIVRYESGSLNDALCNCWDALEGVGEVLRRDVSNGELFRLDASEGRDNNRGKNRFNVVAAAILFSRFRRG